MIGLLANPVFAALVTRLGAAIELGRKKIGELAAAGVIGPAAIPLVADAIRASMADWHPEVRGARVLSPEARERFVLAIADLLIQITVAQMPRQA